MKKPIRKRKNKPEAMSRKDATKMRSMEDTWGARFEEGAKARRLYNKEAQINKEKNAAAIGKPLPGSNYYKSGGAKSLKKSKVPNWAGGK